MGFVRGAPMERYKIRDMHDPDPTLSRTLGLHDLEPGRQRRRRSTEMYGVKLMGISDDTCFR